MKNKNMKRLSLSSLSLSLTKKDFFMSVVVQLQQKKTSAMVQLKQSKHSNLILITPYLHNASI
jgi:hypothetical protein